MRAWKNAEIGVFYDSFHTNATAYDSATNNSRRISSQIWGRISTVLPILLLILPNIVPIPTVTGLSRLIRGSLTA